MPSLAMWSFFLSTAAWIVSTSTTGGVVGPGLYGGKQLTSVGLYVTTIDVPKL